MVPYLFDSFVLLNFLPNSMNRPNLLLGQTKVTSDNPNLLSLFHMVSITRAVMG